MKELQWYGSELDDAVVEHGVKSIQANAVRGVIHSLKVSEVLSAGFVDAPDAPDAIDPGQIYYDEAVDEVFDKNAEFNVMIPDDGVAVMVSSLDPSFARVTVTYLQKTKTFLLQNSSGYYPSEGLTDEQGFPWSIVLQGGYI
jgi:hypothetical protein